MGMERDDRADAEKLAAGWFKWTGLLGLLAAVVVFVIYGTGLVPASVTPDESALLWENSSGGYLEEAGLEFGSLWFGNAADGYVLSSAALALLATAALPTLAALALGWFRRRDWLYGIMALGVCGVLILAILG